MMLASSRGYTDIVKYLIKAGASLDLQSQVHFVFGLLPYDLGFFVLIEKVSLNSMLVFQFPFSVDKVKYYSILYSQTKVTIQFQTVFFVFRKDGAL